MAHIEMHPALMDYSASIFPGGVPIHFLNRAKGLGYTHIMVQITPNEEPADWDFSTGVYRPSGFPTYGPEKTHKTLVEAFKAVHGKGMVLVPKLEISSKFAGNGWDLTNQNIVWNTGTEFHDSGSRSLRKMNPLANDPAGFDKTFEEMLTVIQRAFNSAKSATPGFPANLEYIHLGHGEIIVGDSGKPCSDILIGANSTLDREWIADRTTPPFHFESPEVIRKLMADEIFRRINQVHAKIHNTTKIIIDGDAWDSQHNGRLPVRKAWGDISCDIETKSVATLPGLEPPDAATVRDNLIVMPWQYSTHFYSFNYNVHEAFNHFKNNGLKIMTTFTVADAGATVADRQLTQGRLDFLRALIVEAGKPEFNSFLLGFNSYHFPEVYYHANSGRDPSYLTLEYLAFWNGVRTIVPPLVPLMF